MPTKRKYKRRQNKSFDFTTIKRMFMAFLWLAIVVTILYFVARYFIKDSHSTDDNSNLNNLELVALSPGMEVVEREYPGHRLYFNNELHIPNCVSYEITASETDGNIPRAKKFENDESLTTSAFPKDYTRSGYDRGHMAPAGDMKWDSKAMDATFLMSNICPQNKSLNTGAWHKLERKVREWAIKDSAIIVVCGPIISDNMKRIGETKVAVPEHFFKVLLAPYNNNIKAIGFIFDNAPCHKSLEKYAVSVDSIETLTRYDFFYNLPEDIENNVESKCNFKQWNIR
ncbi:MAG: DNA/RNA non-specific endonuclease [Muribaculaceae bacterium]|nr:DNA/RNA non-specific endonuclease [Muribaculaceae bacterium]